MFRASVVLLFGVLLFNLAASLSADEQADSNKLASDANAAVTTSLTEPPIDYVRDIRPILSDKCYACHGPDEASREADLRLDQLDSVFDSEAADNSIIARGDSNNSELIRRITSTDADEVMPPVEFGKTVSADELALLRRWVNDGAEWKQHWAFVPPQRADLPVVSDASWAQNPIDRFILARLDERGWQPSPEAAKEILIRRVTFDLTGLPPTLDEVDAFMGDHSTDAYERVVDRLLQSPHYGEHMARFWLDAARYGDTHGLHLDNYREMWPYRDWVVNAFNRNLSYDQFSVEQLAGDLLDEPTIEQLVATGFCRAHVTTNEGGSIEEEVFTRNVVDRVSTMGTVFMGLTLGCAACHDHKFDPIAQQDFYQLYAFFNSLDGPALDGNVKDPAPVVSVPSASQAANLKQLQQQITEVRAKRDARQAADDPGYDAWITQRVQLAQQSTLDKEVYIAEDLVVHCNFDDESDDQVTNLANQNQPGRMVGNVKLVPGRQGGGLEFRKGNHVDLGQVASFNDDKSFSYGAWVKTSNGRNSIVLAKTDASMLHRGYELSLLDGRVTTQLSRRQPGYVIKVTTKKSVVPKHEWHHIFVTYDGSQRASGVVIYVDGVAQTVDVWSDAIKFKRGIRNSRSLLIGDRDKGRGFEGGQVDEVRIYKRCLTDADVRAIYLENQLEFLQLTALEDWTDENCQAIEHFYLLNHDKEFSACTKSLEQLLVKLRQENLEVPTTLVYRELRNPREAFVLLRGEYDKKGKQVERLTPASLPPMDEKLPRNRLGLARWLVSAENPLFSRVAVNRFWQELFGTGLVETSDDFGSQGSVPSHPKLLDWLAVDFRESGWDMKALMKQMVMSATYRQSSRINQVQASEDPKNRLLARGPRFRLDAEMLRDQALHVSGLLVPKLGGPSVKPPQPAGLWLAVGFSSSNTVEFVADTQPEQIHRRSLYSFLKRTSPPPEMNTFDAPSRESSCVRRERTNTPLQSLLLMNDPQYVEAAQALANRVISSDSNSSRELAALMYRLCTAREPNVSTLDELVGLFEAEREKYQQDPDAAKQMLSLPTDVSDGPDPASAQRAAWTLVANLILNLDEVITKN